MLTHDEWMRRDWRSGNDGEDDTEKLIQRRRYREFESLRVWDGEDENHDGARDPEKWRAWDRVIITRGKKIPWSNGCNSLMHHT